MKNYKLLSLIIPSTVAWFWLGIWVLFYLKFTDYKGIGLIEVVQISTAFLLEIPTGSLADIIGKKKNIILALLFLALGNFIMGFAAIYAHLIAAVIVISLGGALLSGSWQALLYSSLEQEKLQKTYETKISAIQRNKLVVMAVSSVIGGYLYTLNPKIPFILAGVFACVGMLFCFFLVEPANVKKEVTFLNYIKQLNAGFKGLFIKNKNVSYIVKLLVVASLFTILIELLDPALLLEKGLKAKGLGWFYFFAPLLSAVGINYYSKFKKYLSEGALLTAISLTFGFSLLVSPFLSLSALVGVVLYRNIFYSFIGVISSAKINSIVASGDRATSISTFMAISSLPYICFAFFVGALIDLYGASSFALLLAVVFLSIYALIELYERLKLKPI
jgi:MFS family permease